MDTLESKYRDLSRRDRQLLDTVMALDGATAHEIHNNLDADVSYSTVRSFLSRLETQGFIFHEETF